jgi:hypothetical protein
MTDIATRCGAHDAGRVLVAGTLRGYRTWLPTGSEETPVGALPLKSVQFPQVYWSRTLQARCLADEVALETVLGMAVGHGAPARGCRCGVYAWYRPRDRRLVPAPVFGVIAATGTILMGTHGFRAQEATILAIVTRERYIAQPCERAGIAVYRRRRHLVGDYPTEDLSALLDQPAHK